MRRGCGRGPENIRGAQLLRRGGGDGADRAVDAGSARGAGDFGGDAARAVEALAEDSPIAGVKIGMLGNRANAAVVAEFLDKYKFAHVVLDPVSRPTAGNTELLDAPGLKFVRDELLKRASVITPNIPEAEFLTGLEVKDLHGMKAAGQKLLDMGARAVIVTGGHFEKPIDVLCDGTEIETFGGEHVKSPNTHGSGCTFSSAIAAQLASGQQLREAVILAKAYVTKAIEKSIRSERARGRSTSFSDSTRSRRRAVSTKCRSTGCILQLKPAAH